MNSGDESKPTNSMNDGDIFTGGKLTTAHRPSRWHRASFWQATAPRLAVSFARPVGTGHLVSARVLWFFPCISFIKDTHFFRGGVKNDSFLSRFVYLFAF